MHQIAEHPRVAITKKNWTLFGGNFISVNASISTLGAHTCTKNGFTRSAKLIDSQAEPDVFSNWKRNTLLEHMPGFGPRRNVTRPNTFVLSRRNAWTALEIKNISILSAAAIETIQGDQKFGG